MSDFLETLRAANVAVTILTAAALAVRANYDWATLSPGWRITIVGLVFLIAVLAFGSFEAHQQRAPVGYRTLGVTIACLIVLVGLWVTRRQDHPR